MTYSPRDIFTKNSEQVAEFDQVWHHVTQLKWQVNMMSWEQWNLKPCPEQVCTYIL